MKGGGATAAALVAMLLWTGCLGEAADGAPERDAGGGGADSGRADGGGARDAGGPGSGPGRPIPATPGGASLNAAEDPGIGGGLEGRTSCWDGQDNDGIPGLDCDDEDCSELRSCCVGHGDCCAVDGSTAIPRALAFTGCPRSPTECLGAEVTPFGSPSPWITDGYLFPGGDRYHSGLVVEGDVDLTTRRVTLDATFAPATECGLVCLESAGVALTTQTDFGLATEIRPLVGLVLTGRDEVSLIVAGESVERFAVEGTAPEIWRLVLRPTGEMTVYRRGGAELVSSRRFPPAASARLVLHGRNRNEATSPGGARIGAVGVAVDLCDIPSAWGERGAAVLAPGMLPAVPGVASDPSVAVDGTGRTWLAFATVEAGVSRIVIGRRPDDFEPSRFVLMNPDGGLDPLTRPFHAQGGVAEPELLPVAGDAIWLLYTAIDPSGVRSIGRARLSADTGEVLSVDESPLLEPARFGLVGLDGPTATLHPEALVVVARAHLGDGSHALMVFTDIGDGFGLQMHAGSDLPQLVGSSLANPPAGWDAVEVAAPSLVIHNGAWQLYYARRRGTRWSVGLVTSDELLFFRHIDDGRPVFDASGNGFDRLGVAGPDAVSRPTGIEMVYGGLDGTVAALGWAYRSATDRGSFP